MIRVLHGDCREVLATLPDASVQCCVTSPPYYGLRDYGVDGQMGLEATPDEYVAGMVGVFREVRRVLRDDGVLWLNVGDSYNGGGVGGGISKGTSLVGSSNRDRQGDQRKTLFVDDRKPKDLLGIPWMLAFALRADGWYLRSDCIWHKPNPMPESVRDRPTKAHEYVFLLTKSARYYWDADAVRKPHLQSSLNRVKSPVNSYTSGGSDKVGEAGAKISQGGAHALVELNSEGRNIRTVWTIATQPYSGSHFATMPPDLAERCIKAGSKPGDTVLDPFGGAGTTGLVADRLGRDAVLIELNPDYAQMARERIHDDAPLLGSVA